LAAWPPWAAEIVEREWWEYKRAPNVSLTAALKGLPVVVPEISPLPLRLIPNQKCEEAAFVAGIYDLYDDSDIPDVVLFMHGHNRSWHGAIDQGVMLRLMAVRPPNPASGYVDLLCRAVRDEGYYLLHT
jgi:hypothetical protein